MKNLHPLLYGTLVLALVGTLFTFTSCEKVDISPQNENSGITLVNLKSSDNQTVRMLEFESTQEYDNTIEMLEQEVERLEDLFVKKYAYLSDDDLNEMEEKVAYNDRQALLDFVASKHFTNSMLFAFLEAEEKWLNNDVLDEKTAPYNKYVVEEAEMALLNEDGEVKIAGKIIKITTKGIIEFKKASVDNLIAFNNGNLDILNNANVDANFISQRSSSNCHWWKGKTHPYHYGGNKKVRLHLHFHKYSWKSTSVTRVGSYKKIGNRWKRYRAKIGVDNQSYFKHKDNCSTTTFSAFDSTSIKRRKSRRCRNTNWSNPNNDRAKKYESVFGTYNYPGHSVDLVLYW
jgi:hypothetical protein